MDWCGCSPVVITSKHTSILKVNRLTHSKFTHPLKNSKKDVFFARKFQRIHDQNVLDWIDEFLLHSKYSQPNYYFQNIEYIQHSEYAFGPIYNLIDYYLEISNDVVVGQQNYNLTIYLYLENNQYKGFVVCAMIAHQNKSISRQELFLKPTTQSFFKPNGAIKHIQVYWLLLLINASNLSRLELEEKTTK